MLTKYDIDRKFAMKVEAALTPAHAEAEAIVDTLTAKPRKEEYPPKAAPVSEQSEIASGSFASSEDKLRDLQDVEDPEVEKGKGWKKLVREMLRAAAQPVGEQQDGTSSREVHDPVVPYEDRPEDGCASMPMLSTAPVTDEATGKSYDFLNSMRVVTGPQDIGPGGLFTGKSLPPDPAPLVPPGPVSPERFRRGPVSEGHAASSAGAYDPPNTAKVPATPGGAGRFGKADLGQVLTTRLPGRD